MTNALSSTLRDKANSLRQSAETTNRGWRSRFDLPPECAAQQRAQAATLEDTARCIERSRESVALARAQISLLMRAP